MQMNWATSKDPDQTSPLEAVWYGVALFAQTYPFENLCKITVKYLSLHSIMHNIKRLIFQK